MFSSMLFMFFMLNIMVLLLTSYFLLDKSMMLEVMSSQMYTSYLSFSMLMDYVSLIFSFFICLISFIVIMYSKFYMLYKIKITNLSLTVFFMTLLCFIVSMMFLVYSSSWVTTMMGWDGLGVSSFLLVIFYNNMNSLNSGMLTFITNRLGDVLFIMSFMNMWYSGWMSMGFLLMYKNIFFTMLIMLGMMTKSAQFPFYSWLPAAMAAPTPISSLVHSSTLVTAGVYLLIRYNFLMNLSFMFLSTVSMLTMMMSGMSAMTESDFKKTIAMSTLSQLGFMMITISLSLWKLALLHMMCHAWFKSSLFLTTGNMMNSLFGKQDSRIFSTMYFMSFSKIIFITSSMSLVGFPFSLGFISKDMIIALTMKEMSNLYFIMFLLSCFFTVIYTTRILDSSIMKNMNLMEKVYMKEKTMFLMPLSMSFFIIIYLMKYLFWYFSFFINISFMESMMGIFMIFTGLLMFISMKMNNIFFKNVTNTLLYLNNVMETLTKMNNKIKTYYEETWLEFLTNKMILMMVKTINKTLYFIFNKSLFFSILLFILLYGMMM